MYVYYMCAGAHNSQRGSVRSLELDLQVVVIRSNSGPSKEEQGLLAAESSLQTSNRASLKIRNKIKTLHNQFYKKMIGVYYRKTAKPPEIKLKNKKSQI